MEIRGQLPVYRRGDGSTIVLGATANFGVEGRAEDPEDTISIYATWNIDPEQFFKIFK